MIQSDFICVTQGNVTAVTVDPKDGLTVVVLGPGSDSASDVCSHCSQHCKCGDKLHPSELVGPWVIVSLKGCNPCQSFIHSRAVLVIYAIVPVLETD